MFFYLNIIKSIQVSCQFQMFESGQGGKQKWCLTLVLLECRGRCRYKRFVMISIKFTFVFFWLFAEICISYSQSVLSCNFRLCSFQPTGGIMNWEPPALLRFHSCSWRRPGAASGVTWGAELQPRSRSDTSCEIKVSIHENTRENRAGWCKRHGRELTLWLGESSKSWHVTEQSKFIYCETSNLSDRTKI